MGRLFVNGFLQIDLAAKLALYDVVHVEGTAIARVGGSHHHAAIVEVLDAGFSRADGAVEGHVAAFEQLAA